MWESFARHKQDQHTEEKEVVGTSAVEVSRAHKLANCIAPHTPRSGARKVVGGKCQLRTTQSGDGNPPASGALHTP